MRRLGGLSTEQQVDENMQPFYRWYIHRSGITRIADLIYRMTEHEDIELAEAEYNSRMTRKQGGTSAAKIESQTSENAMIRPTYRRNECCWNCGQRGNRKTNCKRPFKKFCSVCGKIGVLTRECHPPRNEQPAGEKNE